MNNTQADITADLTDKQLAHCYMSAFNSAYDKPGACIHDGQCAGYRAVAALARKGWRPIPKDEGEVMSLFERRSNPCRLVVPAAEGEAQQPSQQLDELAEQLRELAEILKRMEFVPLVPPAWQLRELAEILTRMGFVTLAPPAWPSRLQRAAELLEHPQASAPVPAVAEPSDGLVEALPTLPPRPPVRERHSSPSPLTRWGIQWNGPEQAIALPIDDGYWTPWHVADELLRQALAIAPAPPAEGTNHGGGSECPLDPDAMPLG